MHGLQPQRPIWTGRLPAAVNEFLTIGGPGCVVRLDTADANCRSTIGGHYPQWLLCFLEFHTGMATNQKLGAVWGNVIDLRLLNLCREMKLPGQTGIDVAFEEDDVTLIDR